MLYRLSRFTFLLLSTAALLVATAAVGLAQPSNDDISNATAISGLPFTDTVDTTEATTGGEPTCFGDASTVWYSFTPSDDVTLYVDTLDSDYDTTLTAYTGTQDALEMIDCVDDTVGTQTVLSFQAQAGTTYWIMAGSCCEGPGGNLVLRAADEPPPLPPAPELSMTVDNVGSFDPRTGTATISGTISCSNSSYVDLWGTLRQRAGRTFITGWGGTFVPCEESTTWTMTIEGDGVFAGGRARVQVYAETCNEFTCEFAAVEQEVRLRGGGR